MMTCREFVDNVTEYMEGTVPYSDRIGMWLHTLLCDHCRRYLEQMREVSQQLEDLGERERQQGAPEEVREDLVDQFRAERGEQTSS